MRPYSTAMWYEGNYLLLMLEKWKKVLEKKEASGALSNDLSSLFLSQS